MLEFCKGISGMVSERMLLSKFAGSCRDGSIVSKSFCALKGECCLTSLVV